MRTCRWILVVCVILHFFGGRIVAQNPAGYPTTEEIKELLSNTETAWQEFRPMIAKQHTLLIKGGVEVSSDVVRTNALDVAVPMLRNQPLRFNGPDGFLLFEWLFDASRNAALCTNTAATQARKMALAGKADLANEFDQLGTSCSASSTTLYKVTEKASTLYLRYLKAEQESGQMSHGQSPKQ